jgi:predicted ferric reductase
MTQIQCCLRSFRIRSASSPRALGRLQPKVMVVTWASPEGACPMKDIRIRIAPNAGAMALVVLAIAHVVLWVVARPAHEPTARYIGEICGAEALLLFSSSLVLATFIRPIERAFSGLDRVVVWHRYSATAAVLLLVPHVALITSAVDPYETTFGHGLGDLALLGLLLLVVWALAPSLRGARWPGPVRWLAGIAYDRWLTAHRLTGLFVAVAVVHGALVSPALHQSMLLRLVYLVVGATGVAAYAYRELLAKYVFPIYDYTVAEIGRPSEDTIEVALEPVHRPLAFVPGQFIVLAFGGAGGWYRHPFSVASAPSAPRLEVTIKALGDYTTTLQGQLEPGTPAKVVGPFGGFDYTRGGNDQIWIAGGIGVTPFLSWIRAMDTSFDRTVDFYYSVAHESDALYLDEIEAAAARHPGFRPQVVNTEREGFLTAERTVNGRRGSGMDVWVYMCGPPAMAKSLAKGFRQLGVPRSQIRWEHFDTR